MSIPPIPPRAFAATHVGKVRSSNEDSHLVDEVLQLYVVCDGMGGHASGEVASELASRKFREVLVEQRAVISAFARGEANRKDILKILVRAVEESCATVFQEGRRDPTHRGMGTTLVALLIAGSRGFMAHVGDSRLYLLRDDVVHQLSEDHSLINELLKRGRVSRDQVQQMHVKNAITRAVGIQENVEVDTLDFELVPGDQFLVCSDGLHGYLEDNELPKLFREFVQSNVAERLVEVANERGGKDNITAIVVSLPKDADTGAKKTRELALRLDTLHRVPVFRSLTYQELVSVLNVTRVRTVATGEMITPEGGESEDFNVILSGRVTLQSESAQLGTLFAGEHFGEQALIDRAPSVYAFVAAEETTLMSVRRRDFFELVRNDHDLAIKTLWGLLSVVGDRVRRLQSQERLRTAASSSIDVETSEG